MFNIRKSMRIALAVKGWNMADLATKMNKAKGTISSAIYNGNPTLSTVNEMAKEFNLTLSEFIKLGED